MWCSFTLIINSKFPVTTTKKGQPFEWSRLLHQSNLTLSAKHPLDHVRNANSKITPGNKLKSLKNTPRVINPLDVNTMFNWRRGPVQDNASLLHWQRNQKEKGRIVADKLDSISTVKRSQDTFDSRRSRGFYLSGQQHRFTSTEDPEVCFQAQSARQVLIHRTHPGGELTKQSATQMSYSTMSEWSPVDYVWDNGAVFEKWPLSIIFLFMSPHYPFSK